MATPACALIYTSASSMTAIVIIEPRCKGELNHEIKFVFSVSLFFSAHCRSPCWIIICNSQHFCARTQVVRRCTCNIYGHVIDLRSIYVQSLRTQHTRCRPLNSHAFGGRLTHSVSLSRSHATIYKSHALRS